MRGRGTCSAAFDADWLTPRRARKAVYAPSRQQPVLDAQTAARHAVAGRAVAAVQPARQPEEGAALGGQPLRMDGGLQHGREELLEQRDQPVGGQALFGGTGEDQLGLGEEFEMVLTGQREPAALPAHQMPYDGLAQYRDLLGLQRDRASEADIGEVALGEGELLLDEEGPAVGRAPGGQLYARQLGDLAGGEGARRCPGKERCGRVARLALPPRGRARARRTGRRRHRSRPGVRPVPPGRRGRGRRRSRGTADTRRSPPASRCCGPRPARRTGVSAPWPPGSPARRTRRRRPPRARRGRRRPGSARSRRRTGRARSPAPGTAGLSPHGTGR